ncbi:hypothetical protein LR68_02190 [Anoxybacillus sp. BCO1]|nr:hypothetical protein LR68_02190 [Anoxybacillus sp. BCO1]
MREEKTVKKRTIVMMLLAAMLTVSASKSIGK